MRGVKHVSRTSRRLARSLVNPLACASSWVVIQFFSSSLSHLAKPGQSGMNTRTSGTQRKVRMPSIIKSQRNPSRPPTPFMNPTPYPIVPPKAPARDADARTKAMRRDRCSWVYQKVIRYTIARRKYVSDVSVCNF